MDVAWSLVVARKDPRPSTPRVRADADFARTASTWNCSELGGWPERQTCTETRPLRSEWKVQKLMKPETATVPGSSTGPRAVTCHLHVHSAP